MYILTCITSIFIAIILLKVFLIQQQTYGMSWFGIKLDSLVIDCYIRDFGIKCFIRDFKSTIFINPRSSRKIFPCKQVALVNDTTGKAQPRIITFNIPDDTYRISSNKVITVIGCQYLGCFSLRQLGMNPFLGFFFFLIIGVVDRLTCFFMDIDPYKGRRIHGTDSGTVINPGVL